MKTSTKVTSIVIIFFLIIATVIIGRTMIGNHFKKKFSKRPPPGIIVTTTQERVFENVISTYGTATPIQTQSFKRSSFLILKVFDFFEMAVPNVSIFSENSFSITSVTIIPGGGILLNFFLKWFPIIVLPIITTAIIRKNIIIIEIVFVDLFIFKLS